MRNKKTLLLFAFSVALGIGIVHAATAGKIFCDSFEGTPASNSCKSGTAPINGESGNLWDVMKWDTGKWG